MTKLTLHFLMKRGDCMIDKQKSEAISYLVQGGISKGDIAKMVGVSERSLYRWLNDEEFKAELQKQAEVFEKQVIKESQTLLRGQLSTSIKGIVEIANDNSNKEETRLKAYQYLVDRVLGNTTTKIEQEVNEKKDAAKVDIESTLKAIKEKNKVVKLPTEKAE